MWCVTALMGDTAELHLQILHTHKQKVPIKKRRIKKKHFISDVYKLRNCFFSLHKNTEFVSFGTLPIKRQLELESLCVLDSSNLINSIFKKSKLIILYCIFIHNNQLFCCFDAVKILRHNLPLKRLLSFQYLNSYKPPSLLFNLLMFLITYKLGVSLL